MTDERALLRWTAAEMVAAHCAPHVMPLDVTWQPDLWRDLESNGFTLVGIPEEAGGSGGDLGAASDVLRELSKGTASVPFADSTLLAAWLLAQAGASIPGGPLTIAISSEETSLPNVPYARVAAAMVVVDPGESVSRVAVVAADAFSFEPGANLADEPRDNVSVSSSGLQFDYEIDLGEDDLRRRKALVKAIEISGALEGALEQCVRYAGEREQFGRPIARFQSVQEMLAELAGETLSVRAACDAAIALTGSPQEPFAIAAAKTRASEAVDRSCRVAHQIHGAIGFTDEHVLGRMTRRLWAWRDEAGNELEWGRELGRLSAAPGSRLWDRLAAATAG